MLVDGSTSALFTPISSLGLEPSLRALVTPKPSFSELVLGLAETSQHVQRALSLRDVKEQRSLEIRRLEFVGDGVLDLLIPHAIFNISRNLGREPDYLSGSLGMRSNMLYARFARGLGIPDVLKSLGVGSPTSQSAADRFEAICGAIYLEVGYDALYGTISRFLRNECFSRKGHSSAMIPNTESGAAAAALSKIESAIGYQFNDRSVLELALTQREEAHSLGDLVRYQVELLARCGAGAKKCARAEEIFAISCDNPNLSFDWARKNCTPVDSRLFPAAGEQISVLRELPYGDPFVREHLEKAVIGAVVVDGGPDALRPNVISPVSRTKAH